MIRKTYFYYFAVLGLLIGRILTLNFNFAGWLHGMGWDKPAAMVVALRDNSSFVHFIGGWALPIFVFAVLIYWLTEEHDEGIPRQFLLLPIAYIPFALIVDILTRGEFYLSMLMQHAMVILPYGYIYILTWAVCIWLREKIGFAK